MKKGINMLYLVAMTVMGIVWFLMTFYISKLPIMGRIDASVGCPFYSFAGGILAGFFGCGFMSLFHIVMAIAMVTVAVLMVQGG